MIDMHSWASAWVNFSWPADERNGGGSSKTGRWEAHEGWGAWAQGEREGGTGRENQSRGESQGGVGKATQSFMNLPAVSLPHLSLPSSNSTFSQSEKLLVLCGQEDLPTRLLESPTGNNWRAPSKRGVCTYSVAIFQVARNPLKFGMPILLGLKNGPVFFKKAEQYGPNCTKFHPPPPPPSIRLQTL